MMKTIIAGSRTINDYTKVKEILDNVSKLHDKNLITEVVCGLARGVDLLGKRWATENNIPIKEFPADWDRYGRSAGYKRNAQMADYADLCIVIWDGGSRGSKHMIDIATKKGIPLIEKVI